MNTDLIFLKNLADLLLSGYSEKESIELLNNILNVKFGDQILDQLKEGISLKNIIANMNINKSFNKYFKFFIHSNNIPDAINKAMNLYQSMNDYKKDFLKKFSYPALLICFIFMFSIFLCFFLIPKVELLFDSFGIKKSILINLLFFLFKTIPFTLFILILLILVIICVLFYAIRFNNYKIIEIYLGIPLVSELIKEYYSFKFALFYDAIEDISTDPYIIITVLNDLLIDSDIKMILYEIMCMLNEGNTITDAMQNINYFDSSFVLMYRIYTTNPMQKDAIKQYIHLMQMKIDNYIQMFFKYLIPAIYLFVAIFVIGVYMSIIIPMMNIISII